MTGLADLVLAQVHLRRNEPELAWAAVESYKDPRHLQQMLEMLERAGL